MACASHRTVGQGWKQLAEPCLLILEAEERFGYRNS